MKISRNQLRKIIEEEFLNSIKNKSLLEKEVLDEPLFEITENIEELFDLVTDHNLLNEAESSIKEIKIINEELKRMKQLVDFRSPLMSDENL